MTPFETASAFFHACESLEGWAGCQKYAADNAEFMAQSEPISELTTAEEYCEWMASIGQGPLNGCDYILHSSSYDAANNTALFFGTFNATHNGEGGPVAATQQSTSSHYVYSLEMDAGGKVRKMVKIWNAPWALNEMGWG